MSVRLLLTEGFLVLPGSSMLQGGEARLVSFHSTLMVLHTPLSSPPILGFFRLPILQLSIEYLENLIRSAGMNDAVRIFVGPLL